MANTNKTNWKLYRQKIMKEVKSFFIFLFVVSGIISLVLSMYVFCIGFHNYDSGQNMRWLECHYNTSLSDQNIFNEFKSSEETYILGVQQSFLGFFLGIYSAFSLGLLIPYFMDMKKNKTG